MQYQITLDWRLLKTSKPGGGSGSGSLLVKVKDSESDKVIDQVKVVVSEGC